MRKPILYCAIILIISLLFSSCDAQTTSDSEKTDLPKELSPEEQYDYVFSYFDSKGTAGKERHSKTADAKYYVGVSKKDNQIQFMYISDDKSQGVLLTLDKNGQFGVLVNIKSGKEGVIGKNEMKASEFTCGYEFEDFKYESNQTNWDYDKFKQRANAYVKNTMLYADRILQDHLDIDLKDLGFSAWENPGSYKDGYIHASDVAGMWDYKSPDKDKYSSKIYLTNNKIYWRGYEEEYGHLITPSLMTENNDEFLISKDMMMSMTDPYTGEVVIIDNYVGNEDNDREQFRRYIYRNDKGSLCMRVESVYQGMSDSEDGKIYEKVDDKEKTSISPKFYYPSNSKESQEDTYSDSGESEETSVSSSTEINTYQSIMEEYTAKMKKAIPGLVNEYKTAAAGISDGNRLAEICNDKINALAEICNEGVSEMAELMYTNGDSYDVYEKWAGKLMDNYTDIANEIQDAYIESATN